MAVLDFYQICAYSGHLARRKIIAHHQTLLTKRWRRRHDGPRSGTGWSSLLTTLDRREEALRARASFTYGAAQRAPNPRRRLVLIQFIGKSPQKERLGAGHVRRIQMAGLWKHFNDGGWGMYPIVLWSIITIGVIVERALYLYGSSINKEVFLATMQKCILAGDVAKAVKMCSAANAPLARIVQAGLVKVNRPDEEVQAAMDEAALREVPKISSRTGYLALLANLAMLSGLLGTITGLIKSFGAVGGESVDPSQKARILAEGISEAMNCTAFGLIVAIIGLIGFAVLNGKTQQLEDDINEASVQVLNLVVTNRQKVNLAGVQA
jgi:biopolymer transport protein ExbB/TolQ